MQERSVNGNSLSIGTWRECSFTGSSESYVRHVKEGFGNGASLSVFRHCEGKLDGGLLYRGLRDACNGSLWKRRPVCQLYWHLHIFFCYVELRSLWPNVLPQHSKGYFCLGSGKLNPEVIRKTYPRLIQAFIKAVERKIRELGGHNEIACERPTCIGSFRA